ncbi:MAG: GNAT family N-acetyltransferase [Crocinitomicaceae bacterium]
MLQIQSTKDYSLSPSEFDKLYQIIIDAYAQTEKEVWGENYVRVSKVKFQELVDKGEVLVAFLNNEIVGGVHCLKLEDNAYSFSLLGADFNHSGKGIGKALIKAVEQVAYTNGASEIRIEVLRAENIEVESKIILANWYERLGYPFVKTINVFEVYNDKEKWAKLVNPSVFDCYLKKL